VRTTPGLVGGHDVIFGDFQVYCDLPIGKALPPLSEEVFYTSRPCGAPAGKSWFSTKSGGINP
jgi:hypothetical protein